MKVTCNIIKDLIVLKETDSISDDSMELVNNHLSECECCRKYEADLKASQEIFDEVQTNKINMDAVAEKKAIKNKFGKIKKKWVISIISVIVLIPILAFAFRLTKNQVYGYGLNYSNFNDVYKCEKFIELFREQKYEEAVNMLDFSNNYNNIMRYKETASNYTELTGSEVILNDEKWYITSDDFNSLNLNTDNSNEFWKQVIDNYTPNILIPEDIFNEYVEAPYIITFETNDTVIDYYYLTEEDSVISPERDQLFENVGYVLLETQWGNYYLYGTGTIVNMSINDLFEEAEVIFYAYLYLMDESTIQNATVVANISYILPENIFNAAKEELRNVSEDEGVYYKETYGKVFDMSLDEFNEYMRQETISDMKGFFEKGYTIESINYYDENQNSYVDLDINVFNLKVKDADGNITNMGMDFESTDDKISIYSIVAYSEGTDYNNDTVPDALEILTKLLGYNYE